jgi:hypothetical protein
MRWEAHQRRGIRRGEQKLGGGRGGVALSPASICPHKTRPNAGVRYYAWRARWAGARCVRSPPPLVEAAGLRAQDPHQRMSSFPVSSALGEGKTEGALSSAGNAHRRGHPPTARQLFSGATLARATRPSPVPVEAAPPDLFMRRGAKKHSTSTGQSTANAAPQLQNQSCVRSASAAERTPRGASAFAGPGLRAAPGACTWRSARPPFCSKSAEESSSSLGALEIALPPGKASVVFFSRSGPPDSRQLRVCGRVRVCR